MTPSDSVLVPRNQRKLFHFYYSDTQKMKGDHCHPKGKSKKEIVIKEKAVSGDVQNPVEQTNKTENIPTTTTVITTTTTTTTSKTTVELKN